MLVFEMEQIRSKKFTVEIITNKGHYKKEFEELSHACDFYCRILSDL